MPKEIVRGCEPLVSRPAEDGGVEVLEEGLVTVGWHADLEHVQVATISRHPVTFEVINEGLYVNLDRRGINDLIRNLRRARDQAYGKDE